MTVNEGGAEMDVRKYLSRYHYLEIDIKHMQDEIKEYERLANSIPGMSFDAIRVDGTKSLDAPFTKWIHKAMDKELQMTEMIKQLQTVKCEIISVIDELNDTELKKLLIYRYIDWISWNEIATRMYVSLSTLKRWHKNALDCLKIMDHDGPS
jgi:DNA-directed RNA polymerase specialized sigma subunit